MLVQVPMRSPRLRQASRETGVPLSEVVYRQKCVAAVRVFAPPAQRGLSDPVPQIVLRWVRHRSARGRDAVRAVRLAPCV
eukprot:SAG25_NODE_94_length_15935_cov_41.063463_2_plen_80_part_00